MFVKIIWLRTVAGRIDRHVIVWKRQAYQMTYSTFAMASSGLDESSGTEKGTSMVVFHNASSNWWRGMWSIERGL